MLVVNKIAITAFPAPNALLFCQLSVAAIAIYSGSLAELITLQRISDNVLKSYVFVSLTFLAALYSNVKILQYANVETFIVFRSSTPVFISILDYLFLGRELPSRSSRTSLVCLFLGALAYAYTDSQYEVRAYSWVLCWYIVFCFDQIYIKRVVDECKLSSWSSSFYTNAFASVPSLLCAMGTSELDIVRGALTDSKAISLVLLSCVVGVMMSVSSFNLRSLMSATYFTVVGTLCKIISVLINYAMWDKHASPTGLLALVFCICSATFYRQAPVRQANYNIKREFHSLNVKMMLFLAFLALTMAPLRAQLFQKSKELGREFQESLSPSKTLVIIIGSIRGGHYAWSSFKTNLIDALQADFAYLGPDDASIIQRQVDYNWQFDDLSDWGDFFDEMAEPSAWRHLCSELPRGGAQFLGGVSNCQEGSAGILLAYRELLYRLVAEKKLFNKYDWFILTRSDQLHLCVHQSMSELDSKSIHIASGEDYGGVSDRHAVYPAPLFLAGLGVTRTLLRNSKKFFNHFNATGIHMNLEAVLDFYFNMSGLPVKRSRRTFFGVIRTCDNTRWSSGEFHPVADQLGLKVKYPSELQIAEETCHKVFSIPQLPITHDC